MSQFPLLKLGMLAVKQISKPLANAIKSRAKTTPLLRVMLLRPAQFYHRLETLFKLKVMGLGKVSAVKPLSDDAAVELAADMLGELVVFGVATGCLLYEHLRRSRKEADRENVQNTRLRQLEESISTLALGIDEHNARMRDIQRMVAAGGKIPDSFKRSSQTEELHDQQTDTKAGSVLHVTKLGSLINELADVIVDDMLD